MDKYSLASKVRRLAEEIEALEGREGLSDVLAFHPDTQRLITTRRVEREQINYSVPVALDLKHRIAAYNAQNGGPGSGNIVGAVLDAWLRQQGYPPGESSVG